MKYKWLLASISVHVIHFCRTSTALWWMFSPFLPEGFILFHTILSTNVTWDHWHKKDQHLNTQTSDWRLISTSQPVDQHLSAAWSAPVSCLISTCQPVDQHLSLSLSSRGFLVLLCFLPQGWCYLHIWGYWYFSWKSCFQLVLHPA